MALDPTISLNAGKGMPQLDLMGAAQKGLSLAQLMQQVQAHPAKLKQELSSAAASEASTRTSTAGQQLLNEQTAREAAARIALSDLAKKHTRTVNGKISVDHMAVADEAAANGMDPQTVFTYMQKGSETAQGRIKTAAEEHDFAKSVLETGNNLLRVQKDPQTAAGIAGAILKNLEKVVGPEKAKTYAGQYWNVPESMIAPDPSGAPPDITAVGSHFLNQSRVNAQATISPLEERQMTVTETQISPAYQERISLIPSAGERVGVLTSASSLDADIEGINDAQRAAPHIKRQLGTLVGQAAMTLFNKIVTQDPAAARFQGQIDAYNARNGTNKSILDGVDAMAELMAQDARKMKSRSTELRTIGSSGNIRSTAGTTTPVIEQTPGERKAAKPKETQSPTAETQVGGIIRVNGKTYKKIKAGPDTDRKTFKLVEQNIRLRD